MPNPSNGPSARMVQNAQCVGEGLEQETLPEEPAFSKALFDELGQELRASLKKELMDQLMEELPRLVQDLLPTNVCLEEVGRHVAKSEQLEDHHPATVDAAIDQSKILKSQYSRSLAKRNSSSLEVGNVQTDRSVGWLCKNTSPDGVPILDANANELGAQDWVYVWAETMWDAMPFVGLNVMPLTDSLLVVVVAILNLAVQATFIGLVGTNMTTSRFHDEEIVNTLQDWRISYAHNPDFADKFTSTPLAKDICYQSSFLMQGAQQAGLYNEVIDYIQVFLGVPSGACLAALAIFLWILTCGKEMKRIILFCVGLWTPSTGNNICNNGISKSHVVVQERTILWIYGEPMQKNYQLFVTIGRVVTLTVFVVLPRLIILLALGLVGAQFLIATTELDELILNCVALEVILNVDELLFILFVPDSAARVVRKTKPLRVPKLQGFQARIMPWARLAIVAIIMICISVVMLLPLIDTMTKTEEVMCGGKVDFLAREMVFGSVVSGITTIVEIDRTEYKYRAIYDRTGLAQSANSSELPPTIENKVFEFTEVQQLDVWRDRDIVTWASLDFTDTVFLACRDEYWANIHAPEYKRAVMSGLSSLLGIETVTSCKQLKPWCYSDPSLSGKSVRLLCPETCGGPDPLSGLMFDRIIDGNPQQCQYNYVQSLGQLGCTDQPVSVLSNTSHPIGEGWQNYIQSFKTAVSRLFSGNEMDGGNAGYYQMMLNTVGVSMNTYGCDWFRPNVSRSLLPGISVEFCNVNDQLISGLRSIRAFCPQTCGCDTSVKQRYEDLKRTWNEQTALESQCPAACWGPKP